MHTKTESSLTTVGNNNVLSDTFVFAEKVGFAKHNINTETMHGLTFGGRSEQKN